MNSDKPFFMVAVALCAVAAMFALSACNQVAESADYAADSSKKVIYDTKRSWTDLFTYNPKKPTAQLPQTRYCYQTQADIVCYDSPQANMTAKLAGYQDGANISWFQPGGGSLGVSGGSATAAYNTEELPVGVVPIEAMPHQVSTPAEPALPAAADACAPGVADKPFYCNESPYVKGAVVSKEVLSPTVQP